MTNFSACQRLYLYAWKTPQTLGQTKKHVIDFRHVLPSHRFVATTLKSVVREVVMKGPQDYIFTRHLLCSYNRYVFN
jgi:hypothetical protein